MNLDESDVDVLWISSANSAMCMTDICSQFRLGALGKLSSVGDGINWHGRGEAYSE